mgnify:CR=1 FL=1
MAATIVAPVSRQLTVSDLEGHGEVTLPADYTRVQVRLAYAATGHGYEGDTVERLGIAAEHRH